jgi:hypothetical protein
MAHEDLEVRRGEKFLVAVPWLQLALGAAVLGLAWWLFSPGLAVDRPEMAAEALRILAGVAVGWYWHWIGERRESARAASAARSLLRRWQVTLDSHYSVYREAEAYFLCLPQDQNLNATTARGQARARLSKVSQELTACMEGFVRSLRALPAREARHTMHVYGEVVEIMAHLGQTEEGGLLTEDVLARVGALVPQEANR